MKCLRHVRSSIVGHPRKPNNTMDIRRGRNRGFFSGIVCQRLTPIGPGSALFQGPPRTSGLLPLLMRRDSASAAPRKTPRNCLANLLVLPRASTQRPFPRHFLPLFIHGMSSCKIVAARCAMLTPGGGNGIICANLNAVSHTVRGEDGDERTGRQSILCKAGFGLDEADQLTVLDD